MRFFEKFGRGQTLHQTALCLNTLQSLFILVILFVRQQGMLIHGITLDALNMTAPTSITNISCKSPLTHTPILHRAWSTLMFVMTSHVARTPIRLTCHLAEIPSCGTAQVDADVMGSQVILLIYAVSWTCEATQSLCGDGFKQMYSIDSDETCAFVRMDHSIQVFQVRELKTNMLRDSTVV
jgi:hypothetical protein